MLPQRHQSRLAVQSRAEVGAVVVVMQEMREVSGRKFQFVGGKCMDTNRMDESY